MPQAGKASRMPYQNPFFKIVETTKNGGQKERHDWKK